MEEQNQHKKPKKDPNRILQYTLNDTLVYRKAGERKAEVTKKEESARAAFKMVGTFISQIKSFVKKGFELEGQKQKRVPYHIAVSVNYPMIVEGVYPDLKINYSKAIVTFGKMPVATEISAEVLADGIMCKWNPESDQPGCLPGDQAMLLAYFPEKNYAIELLNGEKRFKGEHLLELPKSALPTEVHLYMSFISADHYLISNSTYLGQFIWQKS